MANTYNWLIEAIDCIPLLDNQTNVVSVIHWRVNGTDGAHKVTNYGTQSLVYTTSSSFIAYTELNLKIVIEWVQTAMGIDQVTAIQIQLDKMIDNLVNPSIVSLNLPWAE